MKFLAVLSGALFGLVFSGCASIDYSPLNIAQDANNRASIAGGIAGAKDGGAFIKKVGQVSIDNAATGREIIVPSGKNTLSVSWFYSTYYKTSELEVDLKPGGYYTLTPVPNFEKKTISYNFLEVSRQDFQAFLCETQKKVQANLSGINPQAAPACESSPIR